MTAILLTGASGFIGSRLSTAIEGNFYLRQVFRKEPDTKLLSDYAICDFENKCDLSKVLKDIDVVIHCAGLAHIQNNNSKALINKFRQSNVETTLRLAQEAANGGVKRFIFLSSIGVNGSSNSKPFTENDIPAPTHDYAISKLEAERGLEKIAKTTGLEVVIIRPPLVYGPGAPGNFATLMRWMYKNIPLPLGAIHNKRSFIGIDNLVDIIITCVEHPAAANQVFLVSDGEDVSTSDFLRRVASSLKIKPVLFPVNQKLLEFALKLIGKQDLALKLCGSLQIDITKAKKLLHWTPPVSLDEGLLNTSQHFLESKSL